MYLIDQDKLPIKKPKLIFCIDKYQPGFSAYLLAADEQSDSDIFDLFPDLRIHKSLRHDIF